MSNLILFKPRAEFDASRNLRGFVNSCRNELTVFGTDLHFDENTWYIIDWITMKGRGNKCQKLVFCNLETVNDNTPAPMAEPFLSFAKAYFRYMQELRPIAGAMLRLAALRALEASLRETGNVDPVRVDMLIINRAAQMIVDKYPAAAYKMGRQLEMLAEFLVDNKLTTVPSRWRNFIKRPGVAVSPTSAE